MKILTHIFPCYEKHRSDGTKKLLGFMQSKISKKKCFDKPNEQLQSQKPTKTKNQCWRGFFKLSTLTESRSLSYGVAPAPAPPVENLDKVGQLPVINLNQHFLVNFKNSTCLNYLRFLYLNFPNHKKLNNKFLGYLLLLSF